MFPVDPYRGVDRGLLAIDGSIAYHPTSDESGGRSLSMIFDWAVDFFPSPSLSLSHKYVYRYTYIYIFVFFFGVSVLAASPSPARVSDRKVGLVFSLFRFHSRFNHSMVSMLPTSLEARYLHPRYV